MILEKIIAGCAVTAVQGRTDIEIASVCNDSRKVTCGALFVAVRGYAIDGHSFIAKAVELGAAAIICEDLESAKAQTQGKDITLVQVESSRYALAIAAANFYDNPSHKLTLVGITGTNGKTTTVTLLHRMFTALGYNCGLLSTIANYVGNRGTEAVNTTSDPLTINSLLDEMVQAGCEYCFMEVSSIGVEQDRVAGLKFKVGIFSNLTHDHLDYHKTFAEYLRCKKLFFDTLPADAYAVTNIDDRNGMVMVQNTKAEVVTYSCRKIADHTCRIIEQSFEGMQLRMDGCESWSSLIGIHNAYNLLAIYTTAIVLGADRQEALVALSSLRPAPGRLENIRGPRDISVIIDYAHTPDALENVLKTLREIAPDRELICLFGCGGDRDKTKRPEMAQIAQKLSDRIIVTSDNSRTEKTSDIMADIKAGLDLSGRSRSLFIEDREEAIRTAIMIASQGATILLAGKGHETYQIIGTEKRHFDEKQIVTDIFKEQQ
ncbi:MAG: UDP-N-acetylmuramoyl-L-alanyl-D-glutamate--2,6-diaminopimelate ligase [Bacteroidales bacterium]|jgi:UDP-N-acetylmuramoyl-L-alanyl-D-glutamate--2,6-diaminopimelate ligase|nr:UDP-N-acetylmuramoyl-L-alanyl-D-glutamate--2,6-diaminopimelate ligase [Bacteroidales bacterium]